LRDPLVTGVQTCALPISLLDGVRDAPDVRPVLRRCCAWTLSVELDARERLGIAPGLGGRCGQGLGADRRTARRDRVRAGVGTRRSAERRGGRAGDRGWEA